MFSNNDDFDLSAGAQRGTIGTAAGFLGWAMLLATAVVTAVHAIRLVEYQTGLSAGSGDLFSIIRIAGVVLVEAFAVVTAVQLATHVLRAAQKPAAMALELTWVAFAGINLMASFSVEHGGELPAFVSSWITYGLPISALVVAVEFYIIQRLSPDARRADDKAEVAEHFERTKHQATLEVLASDQMRAVIRQMAWQRLPRVVGQQLNLSDAQMAALISQAPELLDLAPGTTGTTGTTEPQPRRVTLAEMQARIDEARTHGRVDEPAPWGNGHAANPTQRGV